MIVLAPLTSSDAPPAIPVRDVGLRQPLHGLLPVTSICTNLGLKKSAIGWISVY